MSNKFIDKVIISQKIVGGVAFVYGFIEEVHYLTKLKAKYPRKVLDEGMFFPTPNTWFHRSMYGLLHAAFTGVYHGFYPITYPLYIIDQLYYNVYSDKKVDLDNVKIIFPESNLEDENKMDPFLDDCPKISNLKKT